MEVFFQLGFSSQITNSSLCQVDAQLIRTEVYSEFLLGEFGCDCVCLCVNADVGALQVLQLQREWYSDLSGSQTESITTIEGKVS